MNSFVYIYATHLALNVYVFVCGYIYMLKLSKPATMYVYSKRTMREYLFDVTFYFSFSEDERIFKINRIFIRLCIRMLVHVCIYINKNR